MTRSLSLISLVGSFALAGLGPVSASSPEINTDPSIAELSTPVRAPFRLAIRDRIWKGNTHGMPSGRAVLERTDGQLIWELADVTSATASADGNNVAFLTSDYEVFVSRLPDTPRRIEGGPYLGPALSSDGALLVAQRLGQGGHILEKTFNTQGIALVNLDTGRDRLLLEGNDLFSPSFASDERVFFGSGGKDGIASLYILDLKSMDVARVTNRVKDARQTFPSEAPRLAGGTVVYRADDGQFRVPEPAADDFVSVGRFDAPMLVGAKPVPDLGTVLLRRPSTQSNTPPIFWYVDHDARNQFVEDWNCQNQTYDGHRGTDINQSMGYDVVAPASGEVIISKDGCPDTNSPGCNGGFGNWVAIQHSDRTVSVEAHGKKWTVVGLGGYACGAVLMKSASSGNSSKPHIHHENWADQRKFDPFKGPCDLDDASKWSQQNAYLSLPGTNCTN